MEDRAFKRIRKAINSLTLGINPLTSEFVYFRKAD
jgi:hypothetical protein